MNGWGGAIFSEDRNSQTPGTFPDINGSKFLDNEAGVDGGAIYWYNGVEGTITYTEFKRNQAGDKGGAIALVNSDLTETGIEYTNNAAGNSSTDDQWVKADYEYDEIDDSLSFDITTELSSLYTTYESMSTTETDLYPFDAADELCYVDGSNSAISPDGLSWVK